MSLVKVLDKQIEKIEYRGQAIVTLKQVDEMHERPSGTTRACFNRHKDKLVEGEDYFVLPYQEWSKIAVYQMYGDQNKQRNPMTLLTESGYLMVTKPYTDERSWAVQRTLVKCYFAVQQMKEIGSPVRKPIEVDPLEFENMKLKNELLELKLEKAMIRTRENFTDEEKEQMRSMRSQGYNNREIGDKIGRSKDSVAGFFAKENKKEAKQNG